MKWTKPPPEADSAKYYETKGPWTICASRDSQGWMFTLVKGNEIVMHSRDVAACKAAAR